MGLFPASASVLIFSKKKRKIEAAVIYGLGFLTTAAGIGFIAFALNILC